MNYHPGMRARFSVWRIRSASAYDVVALEPGSHKQSVPRLAKEAYREINQSSAAGFPGNGEDVYPEADR